MALVKRGRLSVQRVDESAWYAMQLLADNGGWDTLALGKRKTQPAESKASNTPTNKRRKPKGGEAEQEDAENGDEESESIPNSAGRKRKAKDMEKDSERAPDEYLSLRRSTRIRK
jgi:hypothetical protein